MTYPILTLLTTATRNKIVNPHITTILPDDTTIKIVLSKKYGGSVNIYNKTTKSYLAFIKSDGTLCKIAGTPFSTFKHILALHKDPNLVEQLAATGQRVGWCCFCGLPLINKISIFHGYGPICAGKYELPWEGEQEESVATKEEIKQVRQETQSVLSFEDDII